MTETTRREIDDHDAAGPNSAEPPPPGRADGPPPPGSDDTGPGASGPPSAGPPAAGGRPRPGRWTLALVVALVISMLALIGYGWWVISAQSDQFTEADAVVVHAGQRHRLRHALDLMDEGVAPLLVLLFAEDGYGDDAEELCGGGEGYQVLCAEPERRDTVGEAIEIGRLADELNWESAVVVTSGYHLRRALYLDRSCTDITIYGEAVRFSMRPTTLRSTVQEMVAMPMAVAEACR